MKVGLYILVALMLVGGVAAGMQQMGVGPFKKAAKKATKPAAAAQAAPVAAATQPASTVDMDAGAQAKPAAPAKAATPKLSADELAAAQRLTDQHLDKLATVYEQMPPEDAGKVLAKLPDPLVQQLLSRMDERQAGKLLLTFDPDRAAKLTEALAK